MTGGYFVYFRWPGIGSIRAGDGTFVGMAGFHKGGYAGRGWPGYSTREIAEHALATGRHSSHNLLESGVCTRDEAIAMSMAEAARWALGEHAESSITVGPA